MSKFQKVTIDEITINLDKIRIPLSSKERLKLEKKYPYYGAQSIVDYVDRYLFDGDYLLIAEDGENLRSQNSNVCNFVTGKFWVNNHAHILQAKKGNSLKYLYYKLNLRDFRPYITGSAQPKLTQDNLNKIELLIHVPDEQIRIADVLSSLDSKIELNNLINVELEAMAKMLYNYWFVQFDFPDKDGKPYKSSGGKMVWNKELKREIPEGWQVGELKDIANITTGKLDSNQVVEGGKYPFFTCAPAPLTIDSFAFDDSVILIAGNNAAGNFHINRYKGKFNAYQRTYVLTTKSKYNLDYLFHSLKIELKHLKERGQGSQTKFLTMPILSSINIFKLEREIAQRFYEFANPIFEKQTIISKENQQLSSLRDWLLPMLMNGQVTVVGSKGKVYEMKEEEVRMAAEG